MTMVAIGPVVAEVAGEGFPVVMLPGLGGTANMFQPQMAALGSYRVVRFDMPGAGRSPRPAGPLTMEGIADAVRGALQALGVTSAHFVGHSMGTMVCQRLAVTEPSLVASLVLFGALAEPTEGVRAALLDRARAARMHGMADIADQIIMGALSAHTREHAPAAVAFVRESVTRQDAESYALNCEALSKGTAVDARRITAPSLLITGDADAVNPPSVAQALADRIPGARFASLDRCAHWATIEVPRESTARLTEFLRRADRDERR
jgi:pimeloyl-ACP methyl ester carboxylesterase